MYTAKTDGLLDYALYSERMRGSAKARQLLGEALEDALDRDQITVHYQPIVDLRTGGTIAFEALARWRRGRSDTVTASEFVSVAEERRPDRAHRTGRHARRLHPDPGVARRRRHRP